MIAQEVQVVLDDVIERRPPLRCNCWSVFQETCGQGCWVWCWAPGDKWTCSACGDRRMRTELVPEVVKAIEISRSRGWTLKLLTLTWILGDVASEQTREGAKQRRKDLKKLVQWIRRNYGYCEYMKVAETHRSGAVHFHLLIIAPLIPQQVLAAVWERFARGAFMVDIRAVGIKCPRCYPGRDAPQKRKRDSIIVLWPGLGKCRRCDYRPGDLSDLEVAQACAWETAKYLGKAFNDGWDLDGRETNRVNRSKGWPRWFDDEEESEGEAGPCEYCDDYHQTTYVGAGERVEKDFPGIVEACSGDLAFYPPGGSPCLCWGEGVKWRRSKKMAEFGLGDLVGPSPPE